MSIKLWNHNYSSLFSISRKNSLILKLVVLISVLWFFSLPEGKSFFNWNLSVVCSCKLFTFSPFYLQNHLANFNHTWHKASLGESGLSLFKWKVAPFPRGDNNKIAKIHWRKFKIFFSRTTGPISTKLDSLGKGDSILFLKKMAMPCIKRR